MSSRALVWGSLRLALGALVAATPAVVGSPPAVAAGPVFSIKPAKPRVGEKVRFKAARSVCRGPRCRFRWQVSSTRSGKRRGLGAGRSLTRTFGSTGVRWVRLTVRHGSRVRSSVRWGCQETDSGGVSCGNCAAS